MIKPITFITCMVLLFNTITIKADNAPRTLTDYAEACGLTEDEFILFSSVVEAESNRQAPAEGEATTEGRVYIALCIWCRFYDERFPSTSTSDVLTQRGQFSTVRNGQSVTNRTAYSDAAVLEAFEWIERGYAPEVLFFNCRGYFSGREPVAYVGGNYFSS